VNDEIHRSDELISSGAVIERGCGDAFGAGASYVHERKSFANVSNNRFPNQSAFCAVETFEMTIPATTPTALSLK
jgi:hypothetical protein